MDTHAQSPGLILDAAEDLFAEHGFDATTIKQIGAAAGVNPALIYYYFGSKEGLYHALLERLFEYFGGEAVRRLDAAGPGPGEKVRELVEMQSALMAGRPTLPRIFARELIDHQASHAGGQLTRLSATAFARLRELIRGGQRAGIFRGDLDPTFAAISVISLVPYFHVARPVVGVLLDEGTAGPTEEQARAYGRHAARFALAALLAPPDGAAGQAAPRDEDEAGDGAGRPGEGR
jgi:AcrR family transcriptional regulator